MPVDSMWQPQEVVCIDNTNVHCLAKMYVFMSDCLVRRAPVFGLGGGGQRGGVLEDSQREAARSGYHPQRRTVQGALVAGKIIYMQSV